MRSSDFSSSVSGRTEIKESNFSKLRLRPSNVRLTCVCVFVFSRFLYVIRVLVFLFLFFGKVGFESKRSVTIIRNIDNCITVNHHDRFKYVFSLLE